ncbi:MAG: hypothetical protein AAGF95_23720 [Chloroflexota bacterium]
MKQVSALRQYGWNTWIVANIVGGVIAWSLFVSVFAQTGNLFGGTNEGSAFRAITGAVTWAIVWGIIGSVQWLVLRNMLPYALLWIPTQILGGVIMGIAGESLFAAQGGVAFGSVAGACGGLVSGVTQWLLIQRVSQQAWWWIPGHMIATASAMGMSWLCISLLLQVFGSVIGLMGTWAICGAISGVIYSAITGSMLRWLLHHPLRSNL